jgi:cytochrome b561/polyisoprenoid-binding protein YceI
MAKPNITEGTVDPEALQARYSSVAVLLHWVIALALGFQLALGFSMPKDASGFWYYQLHKSVGITILVLSLARLAWRVTHRRPPKVEHGFNGFLAATVHTLLYVFMIGAPLTGWALVSTAEIKVPTLLYGAIPWPHLPLPDSLGEAFEGTHELLAWIGLALIALHVAGALRHQLLLKDGLLRRIAPAGSAALAGVLALLVVGTYFATGMTVASTYDDREEPARTAQQAQPDRAAAVPTAPLDAGEVEQAAREAAEEAEAKAEEEALAAEEAAAEVAGPPPLWTIQPGGRLGFTVTYGSDSYRGSFSNWSGTIRFDPDKPDNAPDIRISVPLASASMGDATQDSMLQGGDFFASSANPTATFRSTSVRQTGPGRYVAQGTLSLRGASRPQTLNFTLTGNGLRRRVEGTGTIDRTAFGVGTGDSAAGLGTSVTLNFAFDAIAVP